jgi:hypothetical protein
VARTACDHLTGSAGRPGPAGVVTELAGEVVDRGSVALLGANAKGDGSRSAG